MITKLTTLLQNHSATHESFACTLTKIKKIAQKEAENRDGSITGRNLDIPYRSIYVFKSISLNQAFITTHAVYDNKPSIEQCRIAIPILKTQKKTKELVTSKDLSCSTYLKSLPVGDELSNAKSALHDLLISEGWNVVSTKPKLKPTN